MMKNLELRILAVTTILAGIENAMQAVGSPLLVNLGELAIPAQFIIGVGAITLGATILWKK